MRMSIANEGTKMLDLSLAKWARETPGHFELVAATHQKTYHYQGDHVLQGG